jgi:hypothetical protein
MTSLPGDGDVASAVAGPCLLPVVVSFDIDGTLQSGDPPGPLTLEFVRQAQALGCVVGSCSDRTLREQREMWLKAEIAVDFVVVKNDLRSIRDRYPSRTLIHIGDSGVDEYYARYGGFEYVFVQTLFVVDVIPGHLAWLAALALSAGNGCDL